MKSRLSKTVKKYAIILAVGVAYLIFTLCTGKGIPCIFYTLTGFECPACGVSRMIVSVVRLDFVDAYHCNPFLFVTAPVILFCLIYSDVRYVISGDGALGKLSIILWVEIALAMLFGVVRNL